MDDTAASASSIDDNSGTFVGLSAATTVPRDNTQDPGTTPGASAIVAPPSLDRVLEDRVAALEAKFAEALSSLEARITVLDSHIFRLTR